MARKKREVQEINGGPMADIAFLLLIFFLVTTTIDTDSGIARKLPPMPEDEKQEQTEQIKQRNVLIVLVNRNDDLLVDGERLDITQLRETAREFILNPAEDKNLPEKDYVSKIVEKAVADGKEKKAQDYQHALKMLGDMYIAKNAVISLQNDRATSYDMYIQVQNELTAAYNEIRDEISLEKFSKRFDDLEENESEAVKTVIPMAISEAEPVQI